MVWRMGLSRPFPSRPAQASGTTHLGHHRETKAVSAVRMFILLKDFLPAVCKMCGYRMCTVRCVLRFSARLAGEHTTARRHDDLEDHAIVFDTQAAAPSGLRVVLQVPMRRLCVRKRCVCVRTVQRIVVPVV